MLKLDHLVDNKVHVRSVGSYSHILKQPVKGGKQRRTEAWRNGGVDVAELRCSIHVEGVLYR